MFDTRRRLARAALAALALTGGVAAAGPATAAATGLPMHHTADATTATGPSDLLDVCPIEGDHDLHDSWGWPRSGGRRHQGIDVSAPRGTELYAVRDGVIDVKQSRLGGNSVWLVTDGGDRFFYSHLDGFAGDDREVTAGELIGWVGSTGNARGPHLHFETHPDGQVENPFRHVVDVCAPTPAPPTAVTELIERMANAPAAVPGASAAVTLLGVPGHHHPR